MSLAPDGPAAATHPQPPADRRAFVLTMIALATLLFAATEGLLYYRWATTTVPNCVLLVEAGEPLRGALITVDSEMLPAAHKVVIGDHDQFGIQFFLQPGRYSVKVTMNDDLVFQSHVDLTNEQRGMRLDLRNVMPPRVPSPGSPASAPVFPPL